MKYYIKKLLLVPLYYLFRIFPIKNNKVFVSNYYGKGFGDSAKYIVNEIVKEKLDYDIVWVVKGDVDAEPFPKCVRFAKRNTLKYIYEQVTSKIWIDNCRKQFYERKRKNQYYIQTWHGGFPLKKVEKAVENELDKQYVLGAKNDSRLIDIFLSNNGFMSKKYRTDFWYDGKLLECGLPKNSIINLDCSHLKRKIMKKYGLDEKCKVCLYAPTFRKNFDIDIYNGLDFIALGEALKKRFGGDWIILVKLHPNIANKGAEMNIFGEKVVDVSLYDDMQELLLVSDFMISDYSSCILDYAILQKNCCMFSPDLKEYTADRSFYIKLEEYPFLVARDNKSLINIIHHFDEEKHNRFVTSFFKRIDSFEDGNGAKTVVGVIKQVIGSIDGKKKRKKTKMEQKNKTLLFNTIMMYVTMASTFVFPLITLPFLTRVLGTSNYGVVTLSNAAMQYFQLFIDFGFILSGTAICSKMRDNKKVLERVTSSIIFSKLLLSLVGFVIVCLLAVSLEMFRGIEWFIILSYLPLTLSSFVPDYLFRGIEKMGVITFRTIVSKIVYTIMVFALVGVFHSYYFIPVSLLVSNIIIVVWSWMYIKKELGIKIIKVKAKEIMEQLKASSTFFASRIATTVYSASNIFILGLCGYSDAELGIYGAANTLINYGRSLFSPIADSLYPYMVKNKNHKLVRKVLLIMCPIVFVGCAVLFLLSDLFIAIMAGEEYMDSVPVFRAMIPMLLITLPSYLYGFPMLGSIGRNDKANQSVLLGAGFHFVGLIILFITKIMSFYSIIVLTTITELLILISRVYFFNKYKVKTKKHVNALPDDIEAICSKESI